MWTLSLVFADSYARASSYIWDYFLRKCETFALYLLIPCAMQQVLLLLVAAFALATAVREILGQLIVQLFDFVNCLLVSDV